MLSQLQRVKTEKVENLVKQVQVQVQVEEEEENLQVQVQVEEAEKNKLIGVHSNGTI
jgi:predicted RNA-binding protein Jag